MKNTARTCEACGFKLKKSKVRNTCSEECRLLLLKRAFDAPLDDKEKEILFAMKRDGFTWKTLMQRYGVTADYLGWLCRKADAQFTGEQIKEFYGV